jgi:hypothetical protein
MIAAVAKANKEDTTIKDPEVEDVSWFTIQEVKDMLAASSSKSPPKNSSFKTVPGDSAIAHHLLQHFVSGEIRFLQDKKKMMEMDLMSEKNKKIEYLEQKAQRLTALAVGATLMLGIVGLVSFHRKSSLL